MDSTNEGHAPMKKGSLLAPFALPFTAYFFVGWFKSYSSREALKKATREERGLTFVGFFVFKTRPDAMCTTIGGR
ncbi:hypothetical protein [Diaphorobacter sp.]|uniref:hypothetical protein n=1 Tax=Diaphorobacter sp. TaxID=1934310 RepID=UPI003D140C9B